MENNTVRIEKVLVTNCVVCNLDRVSLELRRDYDSYKGEPGVKITMNSDSGHSRWSPDHTVEICDICNNHIQRLNQVMTANKLSSVSVAEPKYASYKYKCGSCGESTDVYRTRNGLGLCKKCNDELTDSEIEDIKNIRGICIG